MRAVASPLRALVATTLRGLHRRPWVGGTVIVAIGFLLVAVAVSHHIAVPIRDPEGSLIGRRMMLPFVFMGLFIVLDSALRAWRRGRAHAAAGVRREDRPGFREELRTVLAERWWWQRSVLAVVGFMSFAMTYLAYRNLKSYVILIDWRTWDPELLAFDRALTFGYAPGPALHSALGDGAMAHVLSWIYLAYIPLVPISVAAALALSERIRDGFVYVAASMYCWILGVISYFMIPSLGPFAAATHQFDSLPFTGVARVQQALIDHRQRVYADPIGYENVSSIGGFASLHVGVVVMAMLVAWQYRHRWLAFAIFLFLIPTVLATIYFGWHYIIDDVAGVFIGWFAVVSARWTIYPRLGWLPRRGGDPGLRDRSAALAGQAGSSMR